MKKINLLILIILIASLLLISSCSSPKKIPNKDLKPSKDNSIEQTNIELIGLNDELITYIESGSNQIAIKIFTPSTTRYDDGAPVIIMTPTFFTPTSTFETNTWSLEEGFVQISYLPPGKEDRSEKVESTGINDYGGEDTIKAQRDVSLFVLGELSDINGQYISDLLEFKVLIDNVGVYAFSHPGILATNTLAKYSNKLNNIKYFVGRENPTIDKLSTVEIGHWDENIKPVYNPNYAYEEDYSSTDIDIDYSDIQYSFDYDRAYFDLDNDQEYDENSDVMLGERIPQMYEKRYYSIDLIKALENNNALDENDWPSDLATVKEAEEMWSTRETVNNYGSLSSDLNVMLIFSEKDHVQPALDKPHIHQAFDGFYHTANLWTRLNPDEVYIEDIMGTISNYNENDANTEPSDWNDISEWSHTRSIKGSKHASRAAIAEMADRTYYDNWNDDLDSVLN